MELCFTSRINKKENMTNSEIRKMSQCFFVFKAICNKSVNRLDLNTTTSDSANSSSEASWQQLQKCDQPIICTLTLGFSKTCWLDDPKDLLYSGRVAISAKKVGARPQTALRNKHLNSKIDSGINWKPAERVKDGDDAFSTGGGAYKASSSAEGGRWETDCCPD